MPKVYAPLQPAKYDSALEVFVPTMNLDQCCKFGDLVVILPPNANRIQTAPLTALLIDGMKHFTKEDYVIGVGDPTLIGACAALAYQKTGMLRMLKWDRLSQCYLAVEMKL